MSQGDGMPVIERSSVKLPTRPPQALVDALAREVEVEGMNLAPSGVYRLAYIAHNYTVLTDDAR